jgi:hypothetical protein
MKTLCIFLSVSPNRRKQPERYVPFILKSVGFFFEFCGLTQVGATVAEAMVAPLFFCQQMQIAITIPSEWKRRTSSYAGLLHSF